METQNSDNNRARFYFRDGENEMEIEGPVDFVRDIALAHQSTSKPRRHQLHRPEQLTLLDSDNSLVIWQDESTKEEGDMVIITPSSQSAQLQSNTTTYVPPESFGEWASKYDLDSDIDHTLAISVYLCQKHHEKGEPVVHSSSDTAKMYQEARWTQPKNISLSHNQCAKRGFLVEVKDPDQPKHQILWQITKKGQSHLESLIKKDTSK